MFKWRKRVWLVSIAASLAGWSPVRAERLWPKPTAPLEQVFITGSVEQRRLAAAQLAEIPEASAHHLVRRFLQDEDPMVRQRLGAVAVNHCFSDLAEVALSWTQSTVPRERWLAVQLLACGMGPDAVRRIGQLLGDSDDGVRLAATTALRKAGPGEAQLASDFLLLALSDKVSAVLSSAIESLASLGVPFAVLPLVARLTDDDPDVRYQVARALTAFADARAVPALLMALRDSDVRVVEQAIWALGEIQDKQAVSGLLAVLAQPTFGSAQLAALSVLAQLDLPRANMQLARLASRPDVQKTLLENWQRLALGALDFSKCIQETSLAELEFCVQMHLAQSSALGPVLKAVQDHRLSWEDLFRLAGMAAAIAEGDPALDAVMVHALEVVSLAEYDAPEFELLRGAALEFLLRQDRLPSASQAPLVNALGKQRSQERTLQLLLALRRSAPVEEPQRILPYLEADAPLVRQAAARTLVQGQARADILEAVLFHPHSDVAQAGGGHLALGMTGPQTSWVIERAARKPLSKNSPLRLAMYGAAAVSSLVQREALYELWVSQATRDRSWLLAALTSSLDEATLLQAISTASPSERVVIAQLAARRPDLTGLFDQLISSDEHRLVAVVLESRAYVDASVRGRKYLEIARGRPLFVEAAALRALRRAWSRGAASDFDPKWLSTERCTSQNAGLAVAAWGFAAELNQPCGQMMPSEQLLTHPDARVRLEIARGLALSAPSDERTSVLRRCAILERDINVAQICAAKVQSTAVGRAKASQSPEHGTHATRPSALMRVQMWVPWLSSVPAAFPFLIVEDARPKLMVSDDEGMMYLSEPSAAILDASLTY